MQVYGNEVNGYLFYGDTPLELVEKHTVITGRLQPLPDFAYGVILGMRGGKKYAEEVLAKCIEHGAPISALWIEDWQGRRGKNGGPPLWWRWYPDESVYPDFKNWANELKERGIALMGYANPFLSADEGNPLYVEGRENNYFIKNQDGSDYISYFFSGKEYTYVCVDLTNEEAFAWLKDRMRTGMIENGLSGWMADYGEYIPLTAKAKEDDIVKAHCELPMLWAKLNSELIDETGNRGNILAFHRSAGMGSNKYATAYWAGDQNPTLDTYDGLASSISALVTGGISGMAINHTDIGGFTTLITPIYNLVRKKEVMFRWLEYGAFTPVFRTHDGNYANPKNYQFYYDEDGYEFYAKMARIHNNLKFYFKSLEKDMVEKGYPMTRALWLHYPEDPECRKIQYQYLLGQDILVTPVTKEGVTEMEGYIPKGEWILPYDGSVLKGGSYQKIPAKMGQPSVLVRKGSNMEKELIKAILD
jgi:alpha-glucosidase